MPANPNLVPTPVTDKNGVSTVRHMKPVQSASTALRSLPAVTAPPSPQPVRSDFLTHLYGVFSEYHDHDEHDLDEITANIKSLDIETLKLLGPFVTKGSDTPDFWRVRLAIEWMDDYSGGDEVFLRELLSYTDVFKEGTEEEFVTEAIMKMHACSELPHMDDYSTATGEDRVEVERVLRLTEAVYCEPLLEGSYPPEAVILGERMRALMAENPDRLSEIYTIMHERDFEDPDLISSILFADNRALKEGHL
jgi:hypothetical protein